MRRLLLTALAALAPFTALASVPPPGGLSPAQVVSFAPPPPTISCAEGSVRLVEGAPAPPKVWQSWVPAVTSANYTPPAPPTSQAYGFSVGADGQVFDLKPQDALNGLAYWFTEEQTAIIAGWRFAPGAPATGCKVDLAPTITPIAQASPAKLFEILANEQRNAPPSVRKALADSGCEGGGQRRPNVVVYPDLRPFDGKTADPSWTAVRYDVDAGGAVRNVRIAAQHGEAALADAVAGSVSETRFYPGPARTGCFVTYRAEPKATSAPKRPDEASFQRPGDTCKVTQAALNLPETKSYPPAYGKRRVAGWAVVRFDVAPWGQVGAVEVLASQPTAAFGESARSLVQNARPSPPPSGYRGCVTTVVYAIPAIPDEGY